MPKDTHLIDLNDIYVDYAGDGVLALENLNLYIRENEFVTLLGPSGCGKSTTLRIIGGFVKPTQGTVRLNGEDITDMPPHKRPVNTVFQKYALFPNMDVFENVAFGLRIAKVPEKEIRERVQKMLDLVGLSKYGDRPVDSLSGGQQQRVAIARALVNEPKVLLLDEPLGALDLKMRRGMQEELKRMHKTLGITFVYVTHDQEEAMTMSDTVVVMNDGIIQQIGTPQDIYNEPKNAFVANFIGESDILPGIMHEPYLVEFDGVKFPCVDKGFETPEVDVVVRPEDIKITAPEAGMIRATIEEVTFMGIHNVILARSENGYLWRIKDTGSWEEGKAVGLVIEPDGIHIMRKPVSEDEMPLQEVEAIEEEGMEDET